MKIIIIGAGFTGLSAGYQLLKAGHEVSVIEKDTELGGLAMGYEHKGWSWQLEKVYHHLFTNDYSAISLALEIGQKLDRITPKTCVQSKGKIIPFDSPLTLLTFPNLNIFDKLRIGIVLLYLKLVNDCSNMEDIEAVTWIKKYMGVKAYHTIWEPLFRGKFHDQADKVMLPWFWARIKKRTKSLLYPRGGFMSFLKLIALKIEDIGGVIKLNTPVTKVKKYKDQYRVETTKGNYLANKIIYTGPTDIFPNIFDQELKPKRKPHIYLHAQIMVLRLKQSFLDNTYWLNITDSGYPFLVLVDHTNFVNTKNYNGEHITYIGNYLPYKHKYLNKTPVQLFKLFLPYLEKINPGLRKILIGYDIFNVPYAQAVVNKDYVRNTKFKSTGMEGIYIANIDSVYPWDRGVNYAILKGEEIAQIIQNSLFP